MVQTIYFNLEISSKLYKEINLGKDCISELKLTVTEFAVPNIIN